MLQCPLFSAGGRLPPLTSELELPNFRHITSPLRVYTKNIAGKSMTTTVGGDLTRRHHMDADDSNDTFDFDRKSMLADWTVCPVTIVLYPRHCWCSHPPEQIGGTTECCCFARNVCVCCWGVFRFVAASSGFPGPVDRYVIVHRRFLLFLLFCLLLQQDFVLFLAGHVM
jgi:hypothetical protein